MPNKKIFVKPKNKEPQESVDIVVVMARARSAKNVCLAVLSNVANFKDESIIS